MSRCGNTMSFRVLGRILAAQALSSLGTSISSIALAFMVYELTGSMLHMGAVLAASVFPLVVTSFVGGALLDRYGSRSMMVLADLGRAVLIFLMPFLAREAVGLIYLVSVLMGVMSAVFNPGQIKLVGELIAERHLVQANSYLSVSRDGAELVGYLAGGVLVTYVGYVLTFTIDSASYLVSALLILGLPRSAPREGSAPKLTALVAESPAVLAEIWRRPQLRVNLLLSVLATLALVMTVPNTYGLALEVFDAGASGLAALEVVTASGLIVGGLAISRFSLRGDKNRYVVYGIAAMGMCFAAVSFSPTLWLSATFLGLAGIANVAVFVPSMTLFQEIPDRARKGRFIAVRTGFGQVGVAGGYLLGGALGAEMGITRLFLVAGVAGVVVALVIYLPHAVAARRARRTFVGATSQEASRVLVSELAENTTLAGTACWPAVANAALGKQTQEQAAETAGRTESEPLVGAEHMEATQPLAPPAGGAAVSLNTSYSTDPAEGMDLR
jgi:MFS family permease